MVYPQVTHSTPDKERTMHVHASSAYQSGAHQSAQGWIVIALIVAAVIAYRRSRADPDGEWLRGRLIGKRTRKRIRKALRRPSPKKRKRKGKKTTSVSGQRKASLREAVSSDVTGNGIEGVPEDLLRRLRHGPWQRMVGEKRLQGLVWTGVEESPFGVRVRVEFQGTANFAALLSAVPHLEAGLDVRPGTVRPQPGKTQGYGYVEVRTRTPYPNGVTWQPPTGPVRLADPVHLATTPEGERVTLDLKQRILISGESGSGKSGTQRVIAAHVIAAADAELELWDLKRVESVVYEGKARCVTTVDQAAERIEWLIGTEYPRRMDLMARRRVSSWVESAEDPALVLMIDEGNDLSRAWDQARIQQLFSAVEKGRALGVYFVWATQYPKATNLPTELRSQFSARACMRLASIRESRVVLDESDVAAGWCPHLLDSHWVLLRDEAHRVPQPACRVRLDADVFDKLPAAGAGNGAGAEVASAPVPAAAPVADSSDAELPLEDAIMQCLIVASGPMSGRAIARYLGQPTASVARAVDAMVTGGWLVRTENGLRMGRPVDGC